ncbi:hypothetical protein [Escherichia coli]|uniref:hypothetical protein n=1 Tax=Escherichia coli TaxID=562 RepID=UPI0013B45970|nr:hypothetical protein [Escherichia coli]
MADECGYPIEIKVKIFLRVGSKKDIETNTPSGNPEGERQLNERYVISLKNLL